MTMSTQSPDLAVRPATARDTEALTRIALEAKAHWGYAPEQIERWRGDLTITALLLREADVQVAEIDGRPVAFYALERTEGGFELSHLWVSPAYMRQGIGRRLIEHAIASARRRGAVRITIDADPYAEPFYLACGAVRIGAVGAPIEGESHRVRPQMVLAIS